MTFHQTIEIATAPDAVWAVLADVERWPEWTASMTAVERLNAGPFDVGARVRVRQPRLPAAVWTVTALQAGRSFTWENRLPGLHSVALHRVEPNAAGGARVTLELRWAGWLTPLVARLWRGRTRDYVAMEARGLKARCEAAAVEL